MGRWGPDARSRLERAAMTLYTERGFEQTTVAEIAERAGLTERTFFRHFADKREVLFRGAGVLQTLIVSAVLDAPQAAAPMEAVALGLEAAGTIFRNDPARSRQRQAIIDANAGLQARELSKMAALAASLTEGLRQRGVHGPVASLAADAGIVVFRTAFERWLRGPDQNNWSRLIRESLGEFRAVVAGGEPQAP